jgi:hypothetical protein
MILLEGVKSFMVISEYLRDKLNEKRKADEARGKAEEEKRISEAVALAKKRMDEVVASIEKRMTESSYNAAAESKAQGIAQAHQAWADWNRRRMAADETGASFDEPPPEFPQHTGEPK